jgi:HEAT repeat protein
MKNSTDKNKLNELIRTARKGEDAGIRREVIIQLGYEKDPKVYSVLVQLLSDPNSSICHASIISLGRYNNPDAIEEIIKPKILHSKVTNIRWAAVAAMGKLGDFRIIDHLLKMVDDSEWIVRNQAVTELKEKIRDIIELHDSKYARILIRLLALEDREIVDLAIEGFYELVDEGVDLLLDALKRPSWRMRMNAARALGEINTPKAVIPLMDLLQDTEWQVRKEATRALGEIRDKRAVEQLIQKLCDNVEKVQREARFALARYGEQCTEPLLNALVHEKNKFSLRFILLTLGDIKDQRSIFSLIDHLSNSYFVVRIAATRALINFGKEIVEEMLPTLSYNESNIKPLLKDAADAGNPPLQLRAVKALGGLEEHRAVNLLKKLVDEGSPEIQEAATCSLIQIGCAAWGRCGALIVLSEIGDESILPQVVQSLKDDSDNVRLEAVRTLAKINSSGAIDPLMEVARKDRDPYIRFEAVRVLRRIGVGHSQVLGLALSALKDDSRDVRSQAARLLGNFLDEQSIQPLMNAMSDAHWSVRQSSENALINFGEMAVSHLIGALSSRSWTIRFRAARLLGEIGDPKAIDALDKLTKKKGENKKVVRVAKEALNKLRGKVAA